MAHCNFLFEVSRLVMVYCRLGHFLALTPHSGQTSLRPSLEQGRSEEGAALLVWMTLMPDSSAEVSAG